MNRRRIAHLLLLLAGLAVAVYTFTLFMGASPQIVNVPQSLEGSLAVGGLSFNKYRLFVIAFCAVLRREHGFRIGPGEAQDAGRALEVVDLSSERAVRDALRPILSATADDAMVFDRAFADFMYPRAAGVRQEPMPSTRREMKFG